MRPIRIFVLLVLCFLHTPAQAPSAVRPVVVKSARLLDVKTGRVITEAVIIVEDGRIARVGSRLPVPAGAEVYDLGGAIVLPGLIDAHTHLLADYDGAHGGDDANMILSVTQAGAARRALLGAALGREVIEAGITTVRDLGNSGAGGDVALRDAIRAGWVAGPRVVASTRALAPAGGQFGRLSHEAQQLIAQEYATVGGVEDARRAVRQAVYDGADCIKVVVDAGPRSLTLEEMRVIVAEARRANRKVAAHVEGDEAARVAVEAGVDSIEHGYSLPDDVLRAMAAKGIFLVPTIQPAEFYVRVFGRSYGDEAAEYEAGARKAVEARRQTLARALKAGVRIAAGSDQYYRVPGLTRGQSSLWVLRSYAAAGMSAQAVIRAATVDAAELLGLAGRAGVVEEGAWADLVAFAGDPLNDVAELERARFVMKGGRVFKNEMRAVGR